MYKLLALTLFILATHVSIFAQQAGTITGTVKYGNETALHDADVQIVQLRQSTRTDAEGKYSFANVPPGRYTILVHKEGFADATRTVTVAAGTPLTLDFDLRIASIQEQVTVTASGTEQSVFESLQSVNSVGSTTIAQRASTSLGEVLESEAGVAKRSFGPGSARPVIRGFDGDRVLVIQDGVRSGSLGSQSGDHGEPIDPLAAERIEVVKGPGTLLYGSNAIGGVVNVIGHDESDYHDGLRGFFTGVLGSADKQAGASGGVEYGIKRWLLRGNFGLQRTGDYDTPIGRIPNSAGNSRSISFGAGYYRDKAFAAASYGFDTRRYGIPFAAIFEPAKEGAIPEVDAEIDVEMKRHKLRFNGGLRELTNSLISGATFNFDYSDYRHQEIETEDGTDSVGTTFDNTVFSYRSVFEQQKYKRLTGRFGLEGFNREYQVAGAEQLIEGAVRQNSFSVFGLEELSFDRVKAQLGARVESNRYRPENPELIARNFTSFSGGAGTNVGLWNGGAFVVNFTHSRRAPALEELYNNGPHIGNLTFEIGNPTLRIERSNGLDLSIRHQSERVRINADVYYYRISDFVYLAYQDEDADGVIDIEDGLPVARYEQSSARYVGAEIGADVRFNDHIGMYANLDKVRAKFVDLNLNVPRIPPARARIGLDIRYKDLNVRPEALFAGRQDKLYPLESPTAGYGILNLTGSYTIGRQHYAHIITFNAYNLTDKLYRNHLNIVKEFMPEIGRGIRVGYTVRFF